MIYTEFNFTRLNNSELMKVIGKLIALIKS